MKRNYYIFTSGRLRRKDNTIYFENDAGRKPLPISDIEAIYSFGEMDFNARVCNFLARSNIPLHLFNYYGFYSGSFYPRDYLHSGFLLVNQVSAYKDLRFRLKLASEIVLGASDNILRNLKYYRNRVNGLEEYIASITKYQLDITSVKNINELMAIEGRIRERYYKSWNIFLDLEEPFTKRVRRPPNNMINALVSFGNSLIYASTLGEIYRTQLDPRISFLHEPGQRRFSLSLDISEIFKPVIIDKLIFKLINRSMLSDRDFDKNLKYCYLKDKGKRLFVSEYDNRLAVTINHRTLKRQVSYRRLLRLECYKLIKAVLGDTEYKAFRAWW